MCIVCMSCYLSRCIHTLSRVGVALRSRSLSYQKLSIFQVQEVEKARSIGQHSKGSRVVGSGGGERGGNLQTVSYL